MLFCRKIQPHEALLSDNLKNLVSIPELFWESFVFRYYCKYKEFILYAFSCYDEWLTYTDFVSITIIGLWKQIFYNEILIEATAKLALGGLVSIKYR